MFAVCGYATAQNATGSKFSKTPTASAAPTPQKAAIAPEAVSDVQPASDKTAAAQQAVVPAANDKAAKVRANNAKAADATVGADGVVTKEEIKKAEAAKAAAASKNKQN